MLYIIDGTGEDDDDAYRKSMAGGFCMQLSKKAGGIYLRGPTAMGTSTFSIAEEMLDHIEKKQRKSHEPIFLAGHSRGGAAVIYIAQKLKAQNRKVKAMFLYDAVDRTFSLKNVQSIPGNVGTCYHARRNTSLATYYSDGAKMAVGKYFDCLDSSSSNAVKCSPLRRAAIDLLDQDRKMKMAMRTNVALAIDLKWQGLLPSLGFDASSIDFGNCGVDQEPGCGTVTEFFLGSHGAMGGAPIIDKRAPKLLLDADRAAIACVDAWMSSKLIGEGVLRGGMVLS